MKLFFVFLLSVFSLISYAQPCADEDTVRTNTVSLITYNSARINGSISHYAAPFVSLQLKYVRVGQTDTVTSTGLTPLRNITGLQANTLYYYRYVTICATGTNSQTGIRTFTTLANTVTYTPMDAMGYQFKYFKADSGLIVPSGDTSLGRAPAYPSIKYKTSDNTYYAYHTDCSCWRPLAIDSTGIIALLDGKVDSLTLTSGILYYWKNGTSYGFLLPGDSTTASNGLTETSNNIVLGGMLTQNTTISGSNTRSLKLDSLTDFTVNIESGGGQNIEFGYGGNPFRFQVTSSQTVLNSPTNVSQIKTTETQAYVTSQEQVYLAGVDNVYMLGGDSVKIYSGALPPATESGLSIYPLWQDQYSPDSLVWRTHDRTGFVKIIQNEVEIYGGRSEIEVADNEIAIETNNGELYIDTLNYSANADDSMMVWRTSTGKVGMRAIGGGSTPGIDDVLAVGQALTTDQIIDLATFKLGITNGDVGIGISTPDPSAILDITSTAKGLLIPRMTETERDAIGSPATGLMIFQTDGTAGFYYWDGDSWEAVGGGGGSSLLPTTGTGTATGNISGVLGSNDLVISAFTTALTINGNGKLVELNSADAGGTATLSLIGNEDGDPNFQLTSTYGANSVSILGNSGTEQIILTAPNGVGIGVTPTEALDVAGNILASGTITPSDKRFKYNIKPVENSLSKIMSLKPSTYNYDIKGFPQKKFNTGKQYGLIAQDVEKVIPEIVTTYKDSYKGISYSELIPVLIGAIQEQQKQIDELKALIKNQK